MGYWATLHRSIFILCYDYSTFVIFHYGNQCIFNIGSAFDNLHFFLWINRLSMTVWIFFFAGKGHNVLRRKSIMRKEELNSLSSEDERDLRQLPARVEELRGHLLTLTGDLTEATDLYLNLMMCLSWYLTYILGSWLPEPHGVWLFWYLTYSVSELSEL